MPENWQTNGFSDMSQMTALFEAIPYRESCRSFASAPTTDQWNGLLAAADTFKMAGMRIALGMCDTSLFKPFGGLLIKFENVQRFAAIITTDDSPRSVLNAGVAGEMFMLEAVTLGLGGVWVAGTYKHSQVGLRLEAGEKIAALIALGVPKTTPVPPLDRKRKELSQICSPNFSQAPNAFREAALTVHAAPSAMNLQPWLMAYQPEKTLVLSVKRAVNRLDLGIALAHAILGLGQTEGVYTLSDDALSVSITLL